MLSTRRDEKGIDSLILFQWSHSELTVYDGANEIWIEVVVGAFDRLIVGREVHGGGQPGHGDGRGGGSGDCSVRREMEVVVERRAARLID